MSIFDRWFRRAPALPVQTTPATPESSDEIMRRELRVAADTLRRYGVTPTLRADALASSVIGMGESTEDKRETIVPVLRGFFSLDSLDALYLQGGLFRRISEGPAVDAISGGWTTDDGIDQNSTSALDHRLGLRERLLDCARYARAYGRAHLLVVTDDGLPLSEPLPPGKHKIKAVQVLMRRECIPFHWSSDLGDPGFGDVDMWNVVPVRVGVFAPATPVHASRVLTLRGLDPALTPVQGFDLGRGLSVPDAYWGPTRDYLAATDAIAVAALEMSIPVLKLGAHSEAYSGVDRQEYLASLQLMKLRKSTFGMLPLAGSDDLERLPVQFTGAREAIMSLQERICAIEGIPIIKLFGQSPGGLSTDNESGRTSYATLLRGIRVDRVEPVLQAIYDIAFGPADRTIVWGELEAPTQREEAEVDEIRVRRDIMLVQAGIITREEARQRYIGDEVLPYPVVSEYDDLDDLVGPVEDEPEGQETAFDRKNIVRAGTPKGAFVPTPGGIDPIKPPEVVGRGDADRYKVPAAARNNARKVLRWREEHADEIRGMTEVGWKRARQLADNEYVGYETVAKMAAFNRHRKNAEIDAEHKDTPWKDAGYVAWLGWGGTSGVDWARGITGADED
jgi:phage-related protein (TIGR01555 family)